jgi:superfamily II DNA or RNA helicase
MNTLTAESPNSEFTNYDVVARFYNHSYIHLSFPNRNGIAFEVDAKFSYFKDGYKYAPKFKAGIWDGKIHLFSVAKSLIDFGLIGDLARWCREMGYKIWIDSEIYSGGNKSVTPDIIEQFAIDVLKLPFEPFEHQINSAYEAIKSGRLLISSATSSGKSLIIHIVIQWYLRVENKKRIILVVPNIGLVTQMFGDFKDYSVNDSFSEEDYLLIPNKKGIKRSDAPVTITTWQSLQRINPKNPKQQSFKSADSVPSEFFDDVDVLLMDEVQTAKGEVVGSIVKKTAFTPVKIGLSGTIANDYASEMFIKALFGRIYRGITSSELIELGLATQIKLTAIQITHSKNNKLKYSEEIEYIRNLEVRNSYICKIAESFKEENTLILFNNKDQGKKLLEWFNTNSDRPVFYVTGEASSEERDAVREFCVNNHGAVILASFAIFQAGVSIKSLKNVIFASPTKSAIRLLQSIGRVLRKHETKDFARVIDIYDDMSGGGANNHTLNHFLERYRIYGDAQFNCNVIQGLDLSKKL